MVYSTRYTAFIISLIGATIIMVGSLACYFMLYSFGGGFFRWMMGGFYGIMGWWYGFGVGIRLWFTAIGLVCGVLVLLGVIMLNAHPLEHTAWDVMVLVFSVISLVDMGGCFIGAVLGIVGGALAISLRPPPQQLSEPHQ